jgi:hypothetical protein
MAGGWVISARLDRGQLCLALPGLLTLFGVMSSIARWEQRVAWVVIGE